ncbi:response regulator transcription factor [Actinomycetaceae bacterium L2_0104]
MKDTIKVMTVDDDPLVLGLLQSIIARDSSIALVGQAADGEEAVETVRETRPDVVVMDLHLPAPMTGPEAIRTIRNSLRPPRILALTAYGSEEYIKETLAAGAFGYILKSDTYEMLCPAIHAVHEGRKITSPDVTDVLIRSYVAPQDDPERDRARALIALLTDREIEVARLYGMGNRYIDIAAKLYISPSTVKSDLSKAARKTGAQDSGQLAVLVERAQLGKP